MLWIETRQCTVLGSHLDWLLIRSTFLNTDPYPQSGAKPGPVVERLPLSVGSGRVRAVEIKAG